ncbi:MAG: 2-aminoethylphosphonate aminotransferase [Thermoplasmatota archaeon]
MVERKILLNPGPATTTESVKKAQIVPDICPREEEFGDVMQGIREDLVKIAGGDENHTSILFAGSGTAVMDSVINSVVPEGNKILIINNGAYGERMVKIARRYNIGFEELKFEWGSKIELNKVESVLDQNDDIACVSVVHHETTTGILNPIEEIGEITKEYGCTFIVDTISSFSGIPFSIKDCNIDFMMSTSNKCIQGMAGVAFVICKKEKLEKIKNYPKRSFYLDLYPQYEYLEEKKQMRFTVPVQVMYALRQAIDEFFEEGARNRYLRYKKNYDVLIEGLKERGFELFLDEDVEESHILATVVEPSHPNFDFEELHDRLYERGFTIYPGKVKDGKTFRIAVMGAIDHNDIKNFLKAMDEVLNEMEINIK